MNLNGYFLYPFQALIDIVAQLPISSAPFVNLATQPICELNTTDDWINLESLGKPVALRASALIALLKPVLTANHISHLEIIIDLEEKNISMDNLYLLLLLADEVDLLSVTVYTHLNHMDAIKQKLKDFYRERADILFHYVNRDYLNDHADLLEKSIKLNKQRQTMIEVIGLPLSDDLFKANTLTEREAGLMIAYGWICLKSGAYELACHVLKKALEIPMLKITWEKLFMNLQIIQFLSHQYHVVTHEVFPDVFLHLEKSDVDSLYFIKAYAATLDRNLAIASHCFLQCEIDQHSTIENEASLYRLNIYALFLVLKGEIDQALTLELKIEDFIHAHRINIAGLKYVNFINIARLYKKIQSYSQSFYYYQKAYSEIADAYTIYDHIYYNLNLANLAEAAQDFSGAFQYWIKTAIYWLACKNPYALSWRPRVILCQEKVADTLYPISINKVNQFIYAKLQALSAKLNLTYATSEVIFNFIESEVPYENKSICYHKDDLVLYSIENTQTNTKSNEQKNQLQQLLSSIIQQDLSLKVDQSTLAIDLKAEAFITLPDHANLFVVSLSKMIHRIDAEADKLKLSYQRSFLNQIISLKEEIDLIKKIQAAQVMKLEELKAYSLDLIMRMIRNNIVVIEDLNH
ncbi:MAG: hypothetical protein JO149_02820 [Gammaproteobacteria bacterium]|nr:hypothetical protein [Gammaproteobacteria bacterium]